MPEANKLLRCARESVESPNASGEPLTRQELAELVNAWIYENTGATNVVEVDANYIGKLEQGKIRWPQHEHRRAALRATLGVDTDSELGFRRPRRERHQPAGVDRRQVSRVLEASAAAVGGERGIDTFTVTEPTPVPSMVGAEPANDPLWMAYYDDAQHAGDTGHALWELAVQGRFVTDATTRLERAASGHGDGAARSRAISQTKLASLVMVTGDPVEAALLGTGALEVATPIKSRRAADDLRMLSGYARAHQHVDEVVELREHIDSAVATV